MLNHHQRSIGYVDPDLDDGGGHQDLQLTARESFHDLLLLCRFETTVDQTDAQIGQSRGEHYMRIRRCLQLQGLGFFNEWADPVNLPTFFGCNVHAFYHLITSLLCNQSGNHRGATRWQFINDGDFEISEIRHRERAWNRRGRHHQLVRHTVHAFVAQRESLCNTKSVLLVDDHQT